MNWKGIDLLEEEKTRLLRRKAVNDNAIDAVGERWDLVKDRDKINDKLNIVNEKLLARKETTDMVFEFMDDYFKNNEYGYIYIDNLHDKFLEAYNKKLKPNHVKIIAKVSYFEEALEAYSFKECLEFKTGIKMASELIKGNRKVKHCFFEKYKQSKSTKAYLNDRLFFVKNKMYNTVYIVKVIPKVNNFLVFVIIGFKTLYLSKYQYNTTSTKRFKVCSKNITT